MLDSQTKEDLGLQSNWNRFSKWKGNRNKQYEKATGRSFKQDVPDPEERREIYEKELKAKGIKVWFYSFSLLKKPPTRGGFYFYFFSQYSVFLI